MDSTQPDQNAGPSVLPQTKRQIKRSNDLYCWKCQQSTNGGYDFFCANCCRSYHYLHCNGPVKIPSPNISRYQLSSVSKSCPVCIHIGDSEAKYADSEKAGLNQAIKIVVGKLRRVDENNSLYDPLPEMRVIVNPMEVSTIEQIASRGEYNSPEAFLYDVKLILHNSIISKNKQLTILAKKMYEVAFEEYCKISYCYQCYLSAVDNDDLLKSDQFLVACLRPHALVWAPKKQNQSTSTTAASVEYLPAKIVNFCDSSNKSATVDVCFFGSRELATDLKMTDCYAFSKKPPILGGTLNNTNENRPESIFDESISADLKKYFDAVKVMNQSMPAAFGPYQMYSPDYTPLTTKQVYLVNKAERRSSQVPSSSSTTIAKKSGIGCRSDKASSSMMSRSKEKLDRSRASSHKLTQHLRQFDSSVQKKKPISPSLPLTSTHPSQKKTATVDKISTNSSKRKLDLLNETTKTATTGKSDFRPRVDAVVASTSSSSAERVNQHHLPSSNSLVAVDIDTDIKSIHNMLDKVHRKHIDKLAEEKKKNQLLHAQNSRLRSEIETARQIQGTNKRLRTENEIFRRILRDEEVLQTGLWCRACMETNREKLMSCCSNIHYCSQECQLDDWSRHMTSCTRRGVKQESMT